MKFCVVFRDLNALIKCITFRLKLIRNSNLKWARNTFYKVVFFNKFKQKCPIKIKIRNHSIQCNTSPDIPDVNVAKSQGSIKNKRANKSASSGQVTVLFCCFVFTKVTFLYSQFKQYSKSAKQPKVVHIFKFPSPPCTIPKNPSSSKALSTLKSS